MSDDDLNKLREQFIKTPEFQTLMEIEDFEERRTKAKRLWREFITR